MGIRDNTFHTVLQLELEISWQLRIDAEPSSVFTQNIQQSPPYKNTLLTLQTRKMFGEHQI